MAVTNLHEYRIQVRRNVTESRDRHRKRAKAGMMYALQAVVFGTRVDTGRARGNWQATEGRPATGYEPERYDLAGRLGNTDAYTEASAAVLAMSGADVMWLHNGVPYISILEDRDRMVHGAAEGLRTWLMSTPLGATP